MPARSIRRAWLTAITVGLLVTGCGSETALSAPDRAPVESRISVAPPAAVVEPAVPDGIELRSPDGEVYLSSPLYSEPLYRGGASGQELNPVNELPVWWAESGMPATDAQQTVVIAGHNYSTREAPFRALSVAAPGDTVVLGTPNGALEYRIETVGPLPKGSLLADNDLRDAVPGRIILANCDVRDGEPTSDNFIVVAQAV